MNVAVINLFFSTKLISVGKINNTQKIACQFLKPIMSPFTKEYGRKISFENLLFNTYF